VNKMDKSGVPNVRFKPFSDNWRKTSIDEVMSIRKETGNQNDYNVDVELENLVSDMGVLIGDLSIRTQSNSIFQKGDILFGRLRPYLNKWWLANMEGVKSGEIWAFYPRGKNSNVFLYSLIQTSKFLSAANISSGTKMPRADWNKLSKVIFDLPQYEEQNKIGLFFKQLDETITLQQQQIEQQQQYKKAMLQKMFPQIGERVPRVRFNEFNGNWEERRLGDLVTIKSGWSPSNFVECSSVEGNPFLKVDDLNASLRTQKSSKVHVLNDTKFPLIPKGSVIFPKRGAAIMTNKVRILEVDSYMDTNMMGLIPKNINEGFLYTFIEKTKLYKIADTSTIPQINNKHIEPYALLLPVKEEQQKIGDFFKLLDDTIALQVNKLKGYQQLKKALLQRMFV